VTEGNGRGRNTSWKREKYEIVSREREKGRGIISSKRGSKFCTYKIEVIGGGEEEGIYFLARRRGKKKGEASSRLLGGKKMVPGGGKGEKVRF